MSLPRPKNRKRWSALIAVAMVAGVVAVAGRAYLLFQSVPEHWERRRAFLDTADPKDLTELANRVEANVMRLQSYQGPLPGERGRDPAERRLHMTINDANAWLTMKLDKWLANRGVKMPSQFGKPTVHVDQGGLVVSALWKTPESTRVVSMTLDIEITDDGMLRMNRRSIQWGRLSVPFGFLEKMFGRKTSPQRRALLDDVTRLTSGKPQDPRIPYRGDTSSRKMIRLLAIALGEENIDLTFRIEVDGAEP